MRGRLVGAICSLCAGCVLDATGSGDLAPGGAGGASSASSSAESASATVATTGTGNPVSCGDGMVGAFEPCDDGGQVAGDGCSATCAVEPGYVCRGAPSMCTICGDGLVLKGETCEDANLRTDDGCNGCNAIHTCGNGVVEPTEACDQSGAASPCTDTCTFAASSECATAVDLTALVDATTLAGLHDGTTLGATDTLFPEHLTTTPNNQGPGFCVDAGKARGVPIVKHRYVTGPYPSELDVHVTAPAAADANANPVAWAYRGCDVSTLDVVCNDNMLPGNFQPALRTPPLPPLSTVVVAVSGYAATDVGRYTLRFREVAIPWQEAFTELPLAAELMTAPGVSQFCHDNCGAIDVCSPTMTCPDGHFLQVEDAAGAGQPVYLTSPPIAWRGQTHVELQLDHAIAGAGDAAVTVFVSQDGAIFVPVKSFNGPFTRRDLVDLFPAPLLPSATFYVRISFQGSATPVPGNYRLGLSRVRLYHDLP